MSESVFQGSLFSSDFLTESITRLADWTSIDAAALKALQTDLRKIYDRFPITKTPNESQTEDLAGPCPHGLDIQPSTAEPRC
jgi:hypothetical protein